LRSLTFRMVIVITIFTPFLEHKYGTKVKNPREYMIL
jgi:hypothetical protein